MNSMRAADQDSKRKSGVHAYHTLSSLISAHKATGAQPLCGKLGGDAYPMIRTAHLLRPCLDGLWLAVSPWLLQDYLRPYCTCLSALFGSCLASLSVGCSLKAEIIELEIKHAAESGTSWLDLTWRIIRRGLCRVSSGLAGSHAMVYFTKVHALDTLLAARLAESYSDITTDLVEHLPHTRLLCHHPFHRKRLW